MMSSYTQFITNQFFLRCKKISNQIDVVFEQGLTLSCLVFFHRNLHRKKLNFQNFNVVLRSDQI